MRRWHGRRSHAPKNSAAGPTHESARCSSPAGYSYVLGMHAFGLEECNQYAEAEVTGRRALDLVPTDGWAVHAVTHVMEMQGRIDEGIGWLTSREADWATA